MQSIQGFLLINIYAFLIILSTGIVFLRKKRLKQVEDETYKKFLLTNFLMSVSGMVLGLLVNPDYYVNDKIIVVFNKIYLISLFFWIHILTYYIFYISFKDNKNMKRAERIFTVIAIISTLFIVLSKLKVSILDTGAAVAEGTAVMFTYAMFGIGLLIEIICVLINYKGIKNKKYIPVYLLILIGSIILVVTAINPGLNYLINPTLIFVAFIMYHTIENPDAKLIKEVHQSKEISDNANEEKTMFLYNMTQEIREVTSIINDLASDILDSKDYDVIYDDAREIMARASTFKTTTNDILDMSDVDASTIKVYNSKYNIKLLLKQIVSVYSGIAKNKDINFITNIDHDIPEELYGDQINLKEVLTTILNNSTKYTKNGYVELAVNTIVKGDVCRLIITIEDSGAGIKSDDINKLKVEDKPLAVANKLVTLMNGTMLISSDFGVGTRVKIILDQKIVPVEEEIMKYESSFENVSILCVDDSESGLKIIKKLLKDEKVILDIALDGKECLDKLKINKYDIVLLDEKLSEIDAVDLIKKIKTIRNNRAKVILLTKDNSYEYNEEFIKLGFVDYVLKPIKKDDLLVKIDKYSKKDKK